MELKKIIVYYKDKKKGKIATIKKEISVAYNE